MNTEQKCFDALWDYLTRFAWARFLLLEKMETHDRPPPEHTKEAAGRPLAEGIFGKEPGGGRR
jgi:hypothetical protein